MTPLVPLLVAALLGFALAPAPAAAQGTLNGTISGNTSTFVTTTGTQTSGDGVKIDASGNHVAAGSPYRTEVLALVTSDVTHTTSNTTLSNITGLSLALSASASEMWGFTCTIFATSNGPSADFDFGWTLPASATLTWLDMPSSGVGLAATPGSALLSLLSFGALNGTTQIVFAGTIFGGGTSGTAQLQFAQHTSNANTTIASKGSWCRFMRLST